MSLARRPRRWVTTRGLGAGTGGTSVLVLPWTGATWALDGSNYAFNVPTQGSDVILNGAFATDTQWSKGTGWTIASGVATKAAGVVAQLSQTALTAETWYTIGWTLTWTASTFTTLLGSSTQLGNATRSGSGTFTETGRALAALGGVRATNTASAGSVDDVSYRPITLSTLFASVDRGSSTNDCSAAINTIQTGTQVGVVANLDSASSPANYVLGYLTGNGTARLDKVVAGVTTTLLTAAVTFVADAKIEIKRSGNTYQLFYNNAQVGTNQTIADAGIISNNLYGMFSTYSANKISGFYFGTTPVQLFF